MTAIIYTVLIIVVFLTTKETTTLSHSIMAAMFVALGFIIDELRALNAKLKS